MTNFFRSVKTMISHIPSAADLWPETNYWRHVPSNAEELMKKNWNNTGRTLFGAMQKVGEDIGAREYHRK